VICAAALFGACKVHKVTLRAATLSQVLLLKRAQFLKALAQYQVPKKWLREKHKEAMQNEKMKVEERAARQMKTMMRGNVLRLVVFYLSNCFCSASHLLRKAMLLWTCYLEEVKLFMSWDADEWNACQPKSRFQRAGMKVKVSVDIAQTARSLRGHATEVEEDPSSHEEDVSQSLRENWSLPRVRNEEPESFLKAWTLVREDGDEMQRTLRSMFRGTDLRTLHVQETAARRARELAQRAHWTMDYGQHGLPGIAEPPELPWCPKASWDRRLGERECPRPASEWVLNPRVTPRPPLRPTRSAGPGRTRPAPRPTRSAGPSRVQLAPGRSGTSVGRIR